MASADSKFDDFFAAYSIWIIKRLTHSFTNRDDELEFLITALGNLVWYWNFSFIVSELVQVNPDNSLAEWVNL